MRANSFLPLILVFDFVLFLSHAHSHALSLSLALARLLVRFHSRYFQIGMTLIRNMYFFSSFTTFSLMFIYSFLCLYIFLQVFFLSIFSKCLGLLLFFSFFFVQLLQERVQKIQWSVAPGKFWHQLCLLLFLVFCFVLLYGNSKVYRNFNYIVVQMF